MQQDRGGAPAELCQGLDQIVVVFREAERDQQVVHPQGACNGHTGRVSRRIGDEVEALRLSRRNRV